MKTANFKKHILVLLCIIAITSCKKQDPFIKETNSKPITQVPEVKDTETKKYIPVRFESAQQTISLKYLDNSPLVSEIENSDGQKEIYGYNSDQQVITYERYQNDELVYSVDYSKKTDGIIKANQFDITPKRYTPKGYYTLSYNADNQLINIKSYNISNQLIRNETRTYNASGDLNKEAIITEALPDQTVNLTYDQNNGIFKYVANSQLLTVESQDNLFLSMINNTYTISGTPSAQNDLTYSYDYNEDNYPEQLTMTAGNLSKTFKISYKALYAP